MLNKIIITFLLLSFSSCGFQVIYNDDKKEIDTSSYNDELAAIRIKKDRNRLSQELKNNLYDSLNPDYLKVEPKYFLTLVTAKVTSSTFTTSTGASGRNRITITVNYTLKSLEDGQIISTGTITANDNYDVSTSRYGTYTADEYVQSNLTKVLAQNIRNSLVNDLIEMKKKFAEREVVKEISKIKNTNTRESPISKTPTRR